MTVDNAVDGINRKTNSAESLPGNPTDIAAAKSAAKPAEKNASVCKQRLADAIADVPPRRHELAVLRMYMDYRGD